MSIACSIGIFAHNEAANITALLEAVSTQKLDIVTIEEIIVVSSASTDGTDDLVRDYAVINPLVKLETQARREGKASAINLFLQKARADILIVISADVIPEADTIEKLGAAFTDPDIGATGGRPMPVNAQTSFMGYAVHLLWRLHHRMALKAPKLGEMIAFRKIMQSIPPDSAVDEASIEALIKAGGYKLRYIPDALIRNKGPQTLRDFVKQRRRIQNGHLWLKQNQHYEVVSQQNSTLTRVLCEELKDNPFDLLKIAAVVLLEVYCRMLGSIDYYVLGKNPFAWDIARSTKNLAVK
ncbi:MAG TPA: glycosyltransferase [Candidatus Cloacimonadota bacterium]|nr:glycosyltransferase [Candidatus Cloacimonadota bacterium]